MDIECYRLWTLLRSTNSWNFVFTPWGGMWMCCEHHITFGPSAKMLNNARKSVSVLFFLSLKTSDFGCAFISQFFLWLCIAYLNSGWWYVSEASFKKCLYMIADMWFCPFSFLSILPSFRPPRLLNYAVILYFFKCSADFLFSLFFVSLL